MLYGYIYITNSKANNHDIVVIKGDMDSSFVIMKKKDYIDKSEIIQNRVLKGVYETSTDTTLDLRKFHSFLHIQFKKYEHYAKMRLVSNHPARFHCTTKTQT